MYEFNWQITGGRIPRNQWDRLCQCAEFIWTHHNGHTNLVYSDQRTGKPAANQSAIRCAPHPRHGSDQNFTLKRTGSDNVRSYNITASEAMFAILQCAQEILSTPVSFEWEVSGRPTDAMLQLAKDALSHAQPGQGKANPDEPPENPDLDAVADEVDWDGTEDDADTTENAQDAPESPPEPSDGDSGDNNERDLDALKRVLSGDIASKEEVKKQVTEEVTEQMREVMENAQSQIAEMEKPVRIELSTESDPEPVEIAGVFHKALPEILEWLQAGINCMMVGPAGSGKTHLAAQVADMLGRKFGFTSALLQKYELLGYCDANGTYHRTAFRDAFEHGHVYLWDEFDASNPQATVSFNASLENPWSDFPDGIVQRHDDFIAIAAANTYGHGANRQYVGRNALDGATLDRFAVVEMGYDNALEAALSNNDIWVAKIQKWRDAVQELGIRHIISMRASVKGAKMLRRDNLSEQQIASALVFKGLDSAQQEKIQNKAGC